MSSLQDIGAKTNSGIRNLVQKASLDQYQTATVTLADQGVWVNFQLNDADNNNIAIGYLCSHGLQPGFSTLSFSGELFYTQTSDLEDECYVTGVIRTGYVEIYLTRNGKTIGLFKSGDGEGPSVDEDIAALFAGPTST